MLLTGITETVKVITNMNDVEVTLYHDSYTTDSYVAFKISTKYNLYVTLRESKSSVARQLLNSSLKNYLFSRTMSEKLNAPLYATVSYWEITLEITQPPTSRPSSRPSSPSSKPSLKPSSPPSSSPKTSSKSKLILLIAEHIHSS